MAQSLKAVPISLREANAFVSNFHRHNDPTTGHKFSIGVSDGSQLHGVAIVGRPVARMLQDGYTAEVLRVCVNPEAPENCCSFLYGRCWRIWQDMGGLRLVTYTLAQESGASLKASNFKFIREVPPSERGWSRDGREREWKPIYGQLKLTWEAS